MEDTLTRSHIRNLINGDSFRPIPIFPISPRYYAMVFPNRAYLLLSHELISDWQIQFPSEKKRRIGQWSRGMTEQEHEPLFPIPDEHLEILGSPKALEEKIRQGIRNMHGSYKMWDNAWHQVVSEATINGPNVYGVVDSKRSRSMRARKEMRGHMHDPGFANAFIEHGKFPDNLKSFSTSPDFAFTTRKTGTTLDYKDATLCTLLHYVEKVTQGDPRDYARNGLLISHPPPKNSELAILYDNQNPGNSALAQEAIYARFGLDKSLYALDRRLFRHREALRAWAQHYLDNDPSIHFAVVRQALKERDAVALARPDAAKKIAERKYASRLIHQHLSGMDMRKVGNVVMFAGTPYETVGVRFENRLEYAEVALLGAMEDDVYLVVQGQRTFARRNLTDDGHEVYDGKHPIAFLSTRNSDMPLNIMNDSTKTRSPARIQIVGNFNYTTEHKRMYRQLLEKHVLWLNYFSHPSFP